MPRLDMKPCHCMPRGILQLPVRSMLCSVASMFALQRSCRWLRYQQLDHCMNTAQNASFCYALQAFENRPCPTDRVAAKPPCRQGVLCRSRKCHRPSCSSSQHRVDMQAGSLNGLKVNMLGKHALHKLDRQLAGACVRHTECRFSPKLADLLQYIHSPTTVNGRI